MCLCCLLYILLYICDMGNVIEHNRQEYHIDEFSDLLKDKYNSVTKDNRQFFLCSNKINFYNHRWIKNNPTYTNDAFSILQDVKQPSENTVRNAMIWSYDTDYKIKAGGESCSDSQYSSSLTLLIACPKTGDDKEIVIIKKYSNVFKDVLILPEDVKKLYLLCSTETELKSYNDDKVRSICHFIISSFRMNKIALKGRDTELTKRYKDLLFKSLKSNKGSFDDLLKISNVVKTRLKKESEYKIVEDEPNVNKTLNHKNDCLDRKSKIESMLEYYNHVESEIKI